LTVTWLLHSALTWVESSSKLREDKGERGRCWQEEEEEEEEVDKPEVEEHFSLISPLLTLKSGVESREKAPESEDKEEDEEE